MTLTVTHAFHSGVADDPGAASAGEVLPSHWNANHSLSGAASPSQGGTGVANNDASTITITGSFGITFTITGTTSLTLPTSGTVATHSEKLSVFAATTSAELAGVISDETGSGALVFASSPTLVTPALGTPSAVVLTNGTGLPVSTGITGFGTGIATWLATPSSANLRAALTDESGTGAAYFQGGDLGTPSAGVLTNATGLPVSTGITGFAAGVATFLATPSSANLRAALTDETGTGAAVFAGGAIGTPASGTLTNCTGLPLSGMTTQAAWSFVVNNTGSAAVPTAVDIPSFTLKATPAATDLVVISDQAASGALKRATVSSLAASAGVSSIAGNTGAFTLAGGVTNSTNQIQLDGNYTGWAIPNCTLAASVASNILTVALKDNAGNDPSATSPVYINYRSATAATGTTTLVAQTAALSITTNATGATLGSSNNTAFRFWVVVFNNSGTNVLALINCSTSAGRAAALNEDVVASSTAMSGSATSAGVFYTPNGTTVTSKAYRILGYIEYNSTGLATAGTYATGPNFIQTFGPGIRKPGDPVGAPLYTTSTTVGAATSTTFVALTSGITQAITPTSAANLIKVDAVGSAQSTTAVGRFQLSRGTTAATNLFGAMGVIGQTATALPCLMTGIDLPNTTSSTTYAIQGKSASGTVDFPALSGDTVCMMVQEIMG